MEWKLPRENLWFSDCLLKASNAGFASTGIILGEATAVDRISDVGGLQFSLECFAALEEKTFALGSTVRPK